MAHPVTYTCLRQAWDRLSCLLVYFSTRRGVCLSAGQNGSATLPLSPGNRTVAFSQHTYIRYTVRKQLARLYLAIEKFMQKNQVRRLPSLS